jgi:oligogalacturonide lyase
MSSLHGPTRVTNPRGDGDQLLYFTSPSLTVDDRHLVFIRTEDGNPNLVTRHLQTGEERYLTRNTQGWLRSYVYFDGRPYGGFGKASVSLDAEHGIVFNHAGDAVFFTSDVTGVWNIYRVEAPC